MASAGERVGPTFDYWSSINQDLLDVAFPTSEIGYLATRQGEILKTEDGARTWVTSWSAEEALRAVSFPTAMSGWVVGAAGYLVHTSDGGNTWEKQVSGIDDTLFAVHFADQRRGWVAGDRGAILRTINGGSNWRAIRSGTEARLQALSFADADQGWAAGTEGTVLRTTDGGAHWEPIGVGEPIDLFAISFASASRGVAVGTSGRLFYTGNGGRTWTGVTLNREVTLYAAQLTSMAGGWIAGAGGFFYHIDFQADGSLSWSQASAETIAPIRKIANRVGGSVAVGADGVVLALENDTRWMLRRGKDPIRGMPTGMIWRSEKEGWITTSDGIALSTRDRGLTWRSVSMPWPGGIATGDRSLAAIAFARSHGWAVGKGGAVFATRDGGETWSLQESGVSGNLLAVSAVNENTAWAVGVGGTVIRTTDGSRWTRVQSGETGTLTSVFFLDESRGWVAGHAGIILQTSDGNGWRRRHRQTSLQLRGIYLMDGDRGSTPSGTAPRGWAVGSGGTVLVTDNGETWGRAASIYGRTLTGLAFTSRQRGWVVDSGGGISFTDDGGMTWQARRLTSKRRGPLTAISVLNDDLGWAVGRNTIAMMTRRSLPALVAFDAVNTADGVAVSGRLSPTAIPMRIKQLEYNPDGSGFHPLPSKVEVPIVNGRFQVAWDPHSAGYRDGTSFRYRIMLTDGVYDYSKAIDAAFVYKSWLGRLQQEHPLLIPLLGLFALFVGLLLIPRILFATYNTLPWKSASELFGGTPLAKLAVSLGSLVLIPYIFRLPWVVRAWCDRYAAGGMQLRDLGPDIRADYMKREAVLDAWVTRHAEKAREYYHTNVMKRVSRDGLYIPMPVSLGQSRIEIPVPEQFSWVFGAEPISVLVTGPGGSGKSTFAAQLGSWALPAPAIRSAGAMIPVFIPGPVKDLPASIKAALLPIVAHDEDLDDALLAALLRRKRLLVIVDSLSEWPEEERTYVEGIHGKMAISALVITSRREVDMERTHLIAIGALDTASMFRFREQYFQRITPSVPRDLQTALEHGLVEMRNRWFAGAEPTCLLVRMYIDDAISSSMRKGSELAANAPDVILRYVQRLTGAGRSDVVIRIAKQAAKEILSQKFVPQSMSEAILSDKLKKILQGQPVDEGLRKLVDSGIMESNWVGGNVVKFAYDPVAEFLASLKICEDYKTNPDAASWKKFVAKVNASRSDGFIIALQTILASYRQPLQFPEFMRMT